MKKVAISKADDRPSECELGWYHQWAVFHRRLGSIAAEADADLLEVREAVDKVDAWMRTRVIEDAHSLRRRHSETLEQLTSDCLGKWNASDQVGMAEQARKFLADLRRLWNVDTQDESKSHEEGEGMERVAGMTRFEAIQRRISVMQEALKGMKDVNDANA